MPNVKTVEKTLAWLDHIPFVNLAAAAAVHAYVGHRLERAEARPWSVSVEEFEKLQEVSGTSLERLTSAVGGNVAAALAIGAGFAIRHETPGFGYFLEGTGLAIGSVYGRVTGADVKAAVKKGLDHLPFRHAHAIAAPDAVPVPEKAR